jgi:hypothetical protein
MLPLKAAKSAEVAQTFELRTAVKTQRLQLCLTPDYVFRYPNTKYDFNANVVTCGFHD